MATEESSEHAETKMCTYKSFDSPIAFATYTKIYTHIPSRKTAPHNVHAISNNLHTHVECFEALILDFNQLVTVRTLLRPRSHISLDARPRAWPVNNQQTTTYNPRVQISVSRHTSVCDFHQFTCGTLIPTVLSRHPFDTPRPRATHPQIEKGGTESGRYQHASPPRLQPTSGQRKSPVSH